MQFTEHRVFQLDFGPLLQTVERLQTLILPQVLQTQPDGLPFVVQLEPLDARLDSLPLVSSRQLHVPDGEVEAGSPRLDWHYFDVAAREQVALDRVSQ